MKGTGEEFLTSLMNAHRDFRNAKVKVMITANSIWVYQGKAGISWRAISVAVDIPQKREIFCDETFGEDVFEEQ